MDPAAFDSKEVNDNNAEVIIFDFKVLQHAG